MSRSPDAAPGADIKPRDDEDPLAAAIAQGVEVFDLAQPFYAGMPQSAMHPKFQLTLQRRHGDLVRPDGSSGANEIIVTGGHVGTHIDAFAHISFEGRLHGGVDAQAAQSGGRFKEHGAETIAPIICRGLLFDVPTALGIERCPAAYEVTKADLEAALRLTGTEPRAGDVLLVRTGWGSLFHDAAAFENPKAGAPGPGLSGATWLADFRPRAMGSDTTAFERIAPADGVPVLAVHKLLLVERGIHIIEFLALEELAAAAVRVFTFILSPLKLVGATGSPVRPLALRSTRGAVDG
jgi:kynurenine formamidase